MRIQFYSELERDSMSLNPGEFYALQGQGAISTLLGSCIAACLYDEDTQIIGMNHFLLSSTRYSRTMPYQATDAGRFGIQAMELIINEMMKLGARRKHLKAKAFGGASVLKIQNSNFNSVSEANVRFIQDFLKTEGIPLVSSDLGGNQGRIVHFISPAFDVYVRSLGQSQSLEVDTHDEKYWEDNLQKRPVTSVENITLFE